MMKTGVTEARRHFTEYLAKVMAGEEIIITKHAQPVARMSPVKKRTRGALVSHKDLRLSLSAKGKPPDKIVIDSRKEEQY